MDTSRAVRTRAEQAALVEAVRDAPPDEQETNFLEWKGTLDISSKEGRAKIAKAVLGFANRRPDVAVRACGCCAFLLVGVEPGTVAGVEPVDAAKLESGLAPYVGVGVQWRADYVEVDGRKVLIVTVEPPQWGDPIHPVRKGFLANSDEALLREGSVFVRHQASTDPAKPADIDDLSRRAARRTENDLAIDVRWRDESPLRRVDSRQDSIAAFVSERQNALRLVKSPSKPASTIMAFAAAAGEYRSTDAYAKELDKYAKELTAALPDVLLARSVLHDLGLLRLGVVNNTERTFSGVRVEIRVPGGVEICTWKHDVNERTHLPEPPIPYGEGATAAHRRFIYSGALLDISRHRPIWVPDAYENGPAIQVVYSDEDVRAEGLHPLPVIWLMLDDNAPDELLIEWEATAKEAHKRLRGTLTVPVEPSFASIADLLEDPPEHN